MSISRMGEKHFWLFTEEADILFPPPFTYRCMIVSQLQKMSHYRPGPWNLRDTFDMRDISNDGKLWKWSVDSTIRPMNQLKNLVCNH
jgi:hypothetical protein